MGPTKLRASVASAHALIAGWAVLTGTALGCGEPDTISTGPGGTCVAGQAHACDCADLSRGAALCDANGALGICQCSVASAGAAGISAGMASAGMSGVSGAITGGAGGQAGMSTVPVAGAGSGGAAGMTMATGGAGAGGESGMTGGTAGMTMVTGGAGASGEGGTAGGDDGVPTGDYCADAAMWDPAWAAFEEEVLELTNEVRATGADCGAQGSFPATTPLTMNTALRCSSRLHSMDMGVEGYFDHTGLDGRDPFVRMDDAGYSGGTMGENIAKGQQTPQEVVDGWVDSDGHCSNIMNDGFTEIGVGYWEGEADNQFFNGNKLWTQNFGGPGGRGR